MPICDMVLCDRTLNKFVFAGNELGLKDPFEANAPRSLTEGVPVLE